MEFKFNISLDSNIIFHYIQIQYFMIFQYKTDQTPLHFACEKGYFKIVQLLLSQPNIDINCKVI